MIVVGILRQQHPFQGDSNEVDAGPFDYQLAHKRCKCLAAAHQYKKKIDTSKVYV